MKAIAHINNTKNDFLLILNTVFFYFDDLSSFFAKNFMATPTLIIFKFFAAMLPEKREPPKDSPILQNFIETA
jgi:hypothetical protein